MRSYQVLIKGLLRPLTSLSGLMASPTAPLYAKNPSEKKNMDDFLPDCANFLGKGWIERHLAESPAFRKGWRGGLKRVLMGSIGIFGWILVLSAFGTFNLADGCPGGYVYVVVILLRSQDPGLSNTFFRYAFLTSSYQSSLPSSWNRYVYKGS